MADFQCAIALSSAKNETRKLCKTSIFSEMMWNLTVFSGFVLDIFGKNQ